MRACAGQVVRRASAVVAVLMLSAPFTARAAAVEVDVLPDLVYGRKDGLAMTLDVLKPKSGANGAAILYMVSGGWVSRWAPPQESVERFRFLLDKGFTMVIVRHGSSPRYQVPDAVSDVRRAVRYVRHHANQWAVDSPILFVTPDDPPTLSIHGDADALVNISHSQKMFAAMQGHKIKSRFITLPGAGHGIRDADAAKARTALVEWFEDTLRK
jgi:acetyl esterase/lipase